MRALVQRIEHPGTSASAPEAMGDSKDEERRRARDEFVIKWVKAGLVVFWGLLIVFILSSAAGESPVKPDPSVRLVQLALIPEGWSFFTRDPKEPQIRVYRWADEAGRLIPLTFSNTSARSLVGLSRAGRAFQGELLALLAPVMNSTWKECEGDPAACLAGRESAPLELMNWSTTRYICGEVVLVQRPPVPWAWSRARDRIHMDSEVLYLNVDCGHFWIPRYK